MDDRLLLLPPTSPMSLAGSVRDYRSPEGPLLLERTAPFLVWQEHRRKSLLWPYSRSVDAEPTTECATRYDNGLSFGGVNLGSQDYLGLSSHSSVKRAAHAAIRQYGVHSAGSPVLMGNTAHSLALEKRLCEFTAMEHALLFPTGWAAGFGTVKGLVRADDHIVIDERAHACLQEGARSATRNVHVVTHIDIEAVRAALAHIRNRDTKGAVMVVTESLFSMDSDTPDLLGLQTLCREYDATLLVDVAHDLGAMGEEGTGALGAQGVLGRIDLVVGTLSKTFASNGGFLLTHRRSVKEYLKCFASTHIFSNALGPAQAAAAMKALAIVRSPEGRRKRTALMARVHQLREGLASRGFRCVGTPSPIVPVSIGEDGLARLLVRALPAHGVIANLVEYPAVAMNDARLRLQVMATHTPGQIKKAIDALAMAYLDACREWEQYTRHDISGRSDRNAWPPL